MTGVDISHEGIESIDTFLLKREIWGYFFCGHVGASKVIHVQIR
jgi:hypothetical protein